MLIGLQEIQKHINVRKSDNIADAIQGIKEEVRRRPDLTK